MTYELGNSPRVPEISEDDLEEARPRVLAQTVGRYEDLYRVVRAHVTEAEQGERPLDPRYLEIGIRILKEESLLYRLGRPAVVREEEEDLSRVIDPAQQVLAQLVELEARVAASAATDEGA
jgi:hypothetical protein